MARLIVKSPYIKCGSGKSAGGYLKYIATRERVEIIPDDRPPTNKQTRLIAKLVKDFPDAQELMEYEDYLSHPTKATASALITLTLESNWDRLSSMEGYAKYIALRPRAERLGELAAIERQGIIDRLNSGRELYIQKGGRLGRKPGSRKTAEQRKEEYREAIALLKKGYSIRNVAKLTGKAVSTIQQVKKDFISS